MEDEIRKRIVRAAVAWERKAHEHVASWQNRDLGDVESELARAVQDYNLALLSDDVGSDATAPVGAEMVRLLQSPGVS